MTVLVGLACDFCLHLAEAYTQSPFRARESRARDALQTVGTPVVSAGVTTILASIPMCFCQLVPLQRFGTGAEQLHTQFPGFNGGAPPLASSLYTDRKFRIWRK